MYHLLLVFLLVTVFPSVDAIMSWKNPLTQVRAVCGSSVLDKTEVEVKSELATIAKIKCAQNTIVTLQRIDDARRRVSVYTNRTGHIPSNDICIFQEKQQEDTFIATLYVYFRRPATGLSLNLLSHTYTITCSYDIHGNATTNEETIDNSQKPFEEVTKYLGGNSTLQIYMEMLSVMNERVTGTIPLGKDVRLHAVVSDNPNHNSAKVIHCDGTDGIDSYAIIRNGCGDGVLVPKNEGFITEGMEIYGPFFKSFRFTATGNMTFRCIFVECTDPDYCYGSSCELDYGELNIYKRSAVSGNDLKAFIIAESNQINIADD